LEPPGDCEVTKLDNVVLTAHTAGVDAKSGEDMALLAAQTIVQLSRDEWPAAVVVNSAVKDGYKWKRS
jgi:phosphoglycerate dehydrogenase-like enzyme